ncbi:hypothetical protein AB2L57_01040 [Microbacterium sp. HA-8]|uniref:hypothetical protein n=1 Tax=Microbacterium sp. HA-8 TaxID=3234200 RepID=UPI0038F70823
MSIPAHLGALIALATIASITTVALLPVLARHLLRGRLKDAAHIAGVILILVVITSAAAVTLATYPFDATAST